MRIDSPAPSNQASPRAAPVRLRDGVAVLAVIVATGAAALAVSSPDADRLVAIFPPWWQASAVVEAAAHAGQPVKAGRFSSIIFVQADRAGLAGHLRAAGAIVLLDARAAGICGAAGRDS